MVKLQVLKGGPVVDVVDVENAFCPTGEGGGVDPTCGKGRNKYSSIEKKIHKLEGSPIPIRQVEPIDMGAGSPIYSLFHGWLDKNGDVVGQDIMHDPVIKNIGLTPDEFYKSTGYVRASTGNYFEYPLIDIRGPVTQKQRASFGVMWKYVKDHPRWGKYGIQYSIKQAVGEVSGTIGKDTSFGEFLSKLDGMTEL